MKIQEQTVVSLTYELREKDANGAFVEKTEEHQPLVFLVGVGQMLPDFEANLLGLQVGDTFAFGIPADRAYGLRQDEAIMDMPIEHFLDETGKLHEVVKAGNMIYMSDPEGRRHPALVAKIGLNTVTIDFNHPMAGTDLYFTGKVLKIRTATAEELAHGHVHGEGGHHH
jgi:FKBP-type peptidyl-prolyl cis-trans isomerase SlyD